VRRSLGPIARLRKDKVDQRSQGLRLKAIWHAQQEPPCSENAQPPVTEAGHYRSLRDVLRDHIC